MTCIDGRTRIRAPDARRRLGRGGGALASRVDHAIVVPSDDTGRIQVIHLALEHLIVELVEEELTRGA